MYQGTTLGGTDTVTDNGGTDGMTFENLNNVNLKLVLGSPDTITVKEGTTFDQGTTTATVSFTNIENLYLQDSVGGASEKLSVTLSGSGTNAVLAGTSSGDTLTLASVTYNASQIWGQQGADTITGGAGIDTIRGGGGADIIKGNAGQDFIYGGAGADDIFFTNQSHYGANFAASKHDTIYAFTTTSDEMKFSGANFTGVAENDTITKTTSKTGNADLVVAAWNGATVSAGHANQRFIYDTSMGRLYYDGDGSDGVSTILMLANLTDAAGINPIADLAADDIDIVA